jgi:hypothetical protein
MSMSRSRWNEPGLLARSRPTDRAATASAATSGQQLAVGAKLRTAQGGGPPSKLLELGSNAATRPSRESHTLTRHFADADASVAAVVGAGGSCWVTDGQWCDAEATLGMTRCFERKEIAGHADSCDWLTDSVRRCEPVIARVRRIDHERKCHDLAPIP